MRNHSNTRRKPPSADSRTLAKIIQFSRKPAITKAEKPETDGYFNFDALFVPKDCEAGVCPVDGDSEGL